MKTRAATSIGWLHLADLHQTLRRPSWPSPAVREQVFDDLATLHDRAGPWDLLIVAGDLSMRGAPEELEQAEQTLDELLDHLRRLGSDPCLLAVPGNHDLVRAEGTQAAHRALRRYVDDPAAREELWNDPESPGRRLVDRALEPFERWWNARTFPPHVRVRRGLLPGDFTATLEKGGLRFGVAGLCSTFLQVTGDDYRGRLGLSPHQLTVAAGGDVPAWIAQHDAAVLVTHHPPEWLAPAELREYEAEINPAGRFCAHLAAHFHGAGPLVEAGERVQIRCASFFGIEAWEGERGQAGERLFGYNAARLALDGGEGRLAVYPRVRRSQRMKPAFAFADLDPDGAVTLPAPRFPRLAEDAPPFLLERAALRDALAAVYRAPRDARRLAQEAGVTCDDNAAGGAAVDVWHAVVTEADGQERLATLVRIARLEYPADSGIPEAWAAFERATAQAPSDAPVRRGSRDEKRGDELFEQLAQLPRSAFEAVLSTLSLTDLVPGPDAPQPTRAMAAVRHLENHGVAGLERLAAAVIRAGAAPLSPGPRGAGAPQRRPRAPTRPTLTKLLSVMFSDERDFDGFVLNHYHAVYARFTNGMNRAYRIRLLLEAAEPADIAARLKRAYPRAFDEHQRVLDYEDVADPAAAPVRFRGR